MTVELAVRLIRESIEDVNAERPENEVIPFGLDLPLYGVGSPLDSLDFVNFTAGLEERLQRDAGVSLSLASALFDDESVQPFASVKRLADYLASPAR